MVGRLVRDPLPITRGGTGSRTATASFNALSPLTTLGDILSNDGTNDVRVAVGAADTFLGSTGAAVPSWRTAAQVLTSLGRTTGTFTPAITFGGGNTGITYSLQSGRYIKFSTGVQWSCQITLTAKGSSTGAALITNLPFTAAGVSFVSALRVTGMTSGVGDTLLMPFILASTATLRIDKISSGNAVQLTDADFTNSSGLLFGGTYESA